MADPSGTNTAPAIVSGATAGGDLSGTFPNATVAKIGGVAAGPAATAIIGQIPGIASNTAAVAGNIGEFLSTSLASGSARALSTGVTTTVVALSLAAGDYDVWGFGFVTVPAITVLTKLNIGINSASALPSATTGALGQLSLGAGLTGGTDTGTQAGPTQILLAAAGTAYLMGNVAFSVSTASIYGTINARRRR
jgi:hypothetical protein